ncbi:MAG: metallophosphoesterase [Ekhidna sp.]|uniref:metallophosphoesterase n=1 Tax=Ekhidna sp. TaxID=2608089 RepID=UPI0032EC1714
MSRIYFLIFLVSIYLVLDFYVFVAVRSLVEGMAPVWRRTILIGYWAVSIFSLVGVLLYRQLDPKQFQNLRLYITTFFFVMFMGKVFATVFLLLEDVRRGVTWLVNLFPFVEDKFSTSRSDFMKKSALVAGAIPVATMSFGVISGAYDYRVRNRTVYSPNLPKAFDGIRVAQISDIHTGSFFNKTAVEGGVDMLNAQKPDIAFFTGDLVNNRSSEAKDYLDIFKKVSAPLGVFSVMGNHDYGDYTDWSSKEAKQKDIRNLHEMHKYMGYDLLLNENRKIKVDGEEIAILGCENWGAGRFSKYGDMKKTIAGAEENPYKLLLSHDPSHWDAQIRQEYSDIDLVLSGHTHGFQFGIEIGDFRWSPVQYRYKQWADLYQEGNQSLYVNRGYGFIGYPGRIGILPEITILELKRS